MQRFATSTEYLKALSLNPDLAVVSIAMAAECRGVGRATIERQLAVNGLGGLMIGKTRCVLARDLIALNQHDQDQIAKVRQFVEAYAVQGRSVFYEPVMNAIGMKPSIPRHRLQIGVILGQVSRQTWAEHRILLSVLVHKKTAGTTRPSDSFFDLVRDVQHPEYDDDTDIDAFIDAEMQKVWEHYMG